VKKSEALRRWRGLEAGLPILPHMTPIPYKAKGTTYGACGIRIDGNPAFVDAVLSRLQDVLAGENQVTRLGLNRREVNGDFKPCYNRDKGAECCYIRLHVRGRQSASMTTWGSTPEQREATGAYAEAMGIATE